MLLILLALFPLICLIATGYVLKQLHWLSDEFWAGAEKINYYLLFPSLLLHSLIKANIDFIPMQRVLLVMCLVVILATILLYLLKFYKKIPPARFGVHVQSFIRFNTYMSIALVSTLYGQQGVAILAILAAVAIPLINVISIVALTQREQMALGPLLMINLKNPLMLASIVGIAFNLIAMPIWQGLENLLNLLAACSLPLGLLSIGAALKFKQIRKDLSSLTLNTFGRLILMPILAFTVSFFWALPTLQHSILIIFFSLPTASASYILTKLLGGDSQLMAAVISLQTLCAAITLPCIIFLIHQFI